MGKGEDVVLNCAAQRVTEYFTNSLRGKGLTDTRIKTINKWSEDVKTAGARITDIAELEKKLKFPIKIQTLTNEILYDSGKYRTKGAPIMIIHHNAHAWTRGVTIFPAERKIKIYNGEMMEEIYNISRTDPVSVCLFRSDETGEFDQFVLPSGSIYRKQYLQTEMEQVALKYTRSINVVNVDVPVDNDGDLSDFIPSPIQSILDMSLSMTGGATDFVSKLTCNCFTVPSVVAHFARRKNSWRPKPFEFLEDVQCSCIEYKHGGLWNTTYDHNGVISVDMVACYPASFLGLGECSPYFSRFGHPTHEMTRVAVNGELPDYDLTGFASIESFEFDTCVHPIIPNWFGSHFTDYRWAPIVLLRYMLDAKILVRLTVNEVLISYKPQREVWLPEQCEDKKENSFSKDIGRRIIGKFTSRAASGSKRCCTRLIIDKAELDFVINDTIKRGVFLNTERVLLQNGSELGTIISYNDGDSPQFTHLRSSMLAYVSINLLSMITRFTNEAVRVATDSFYISKSNLLTTSLVNLSDEADWGSWRIKNELIHRYSEFADYKPAAGYYKNEKISDKSLAPSANDPISRHKTVYLNGPGGSGKTTRAIELLKLCDLVVLTPTHRLAREMKLRGVKSCTYHSFFRWRGDEWNPSRMGQKHIPKIIIWDEICTVSLETLQPFLDWLKTKSTAIIMCGDHGQPPPFTGKSPHCWLIDNVDYYEEMLEDHRAIDESLKQLKVTMRLKSNETQCSLIRSHIPETTIDDFWKLWHPDNLIVASRKIVRDTLQLKLFSLHKEKFPNNPVPLCYRPVDTSKQNIDVVIPGRDDNGQQKKTKTCS